MNATLEIPDELFQQAAAKAARENREVQDLVSEGLRLVLNWPASVPNERRQRMQRAPVQIREGNVLPVLSNDDMVILLERSGERLP